METQQDKQTYLSFKLNNELFAVNVNKVLEVLEKQHVTKIPRAPAYVNGIINFRGEVLPVIDARKKFLMPEREAHLKYVIIVLDLEKDNGTYRLGAIADGVKDVMEINEHEIQEVPKLGMNYNTEFIKGTIYTDNGFMMLLDVDKVFSHEEIELVTHLSEVPIDELEQHPKKKAKKK